jgi:hypothetical protein
MKLSGRARSAQHGSRCLMNRVLELVPDRSGDLQEIAGGLLTQEGVFEGHQHVVLDSCERPVVSVRPQENLHQAEGTPAVRRGQRTEPPKRWKA